MIPVDFADRHLAIIDVIRAIPSGHVATYGQVARLAGLAGRARLVGRLLSAEGLPELPWHRVVSARGTLSTPGGSLGEQARRLGREGVQFDERGRIDLSVYQWPAGSDRNHRRSADFVADNAASIRRPR